MRRTLGKVYLKYRQGLFTLALSITRNTDRAEDAVHEAFTRLCARPTPPTGDVVPYVFAAVRNAAIDQIRRGPRAGEDVSFFQAETTDPADAIAETEQARLLREAVESLPTDQRDAVVLRIYSGLTFDQVALALGAPLQTVASRYRRALAKLRERCGKLL